MTHSLIAAFANAVLNGRHDEESIAAYERAEDDLARALRGAEKPEDICECGDFRHQHDERGWCKHNKPNGIGHGFAGNCYQFRLPARNDEEAMSQEVGTGRYAGKCINGPYAGQMWVHHSDRKPVVILEGALMREGAYEFMDGVWIWDGPRCTPERKP